jgi:hypothetical protein
MSSFSTQKFPSGRVFEIFRNIRDFDYSRGSIIQPKTGRQVAGLRKMLHKTEIHQITGPRKFPNPSMHFSGCFSKLIQQFELGFRVLVVVRPSQQKQVLVCACAGICAVFVCWFLSYSFCSEFDRQRGREENYTVRVGLT